MSLEAIGTRASPYQGLTPFDERDAEYFFGREREARLITADLFAAPVSLLYGASGVGKSSVLRAGVMPILRQRSDLLALVFSEWQSEPLERLKQAVLRALPGGGVDPGQRLAPFLRACARASGRRLMIVLDQFEEYSLYHPTNDEPFAQQFPEATTLSDLSVSFMVSLREEAVARLDRFEGRIPTLFDNMRRIDHLSEEAARSAIELPLQKYTGGAVSAEPELVTAVLDQVRTGRVQIGETGRGTTGESGGRIEAPYLQLVMTRIWNEEQEEESPLLRLTTLTRLGGAPKIVQAHLNAVMARLDDEERDIAARVFQQLVTPSGTKIAHSVGDLADYAGVDAAKLRRVLESLSHGTDRILRPVAELPDRPGDPRYEIFHDRLAPAILDWRARQVKAQEVTETRAREEDERRYNTELLRSHVRLALDSLGDADRVAAERLLGSIAARSGTERLVAAEDLYELGPAASIKRALDALTRSLILREERRTGSLQFSLAHEALIAPIRELLQGFAPKPAALELPSPRPEKLLDVQVIAKLLMSGQLVVVLGSGASTSSRPPGAIWTPDSPFLPTGAELQRHLAAHVGLPRELEHASLSEVASYVDLLSGPKYLHHLLDGVFATTSHSAYVHRFLARVAQARPLVVLTTTYDDLLERELDLAGVRFGVAHNTLDRRRPLVWRGQPIPVKEFAPPADETLIYKMFGTVGSYLVTEEDDMELFAHLAEGRLPPPFVREALASRHVLFLGMGLGTWPQRLMLRQLRGPEERTRGWAIVGRLGEHDRMRWRAARVEAFTDDIEDFARRLSAEIGSSES